MAEETNFNNRSNTNVGLRFVTGFKYAENVLKSINGLTFFYDPNWEKGTSTDTRTLPIAFFHLKGIHEVMESEVQTKKILFYNSANKVNADSVTGSILNVVADNIVNKPKQYKLDVIVPFESLTMLSKSANFSAYQTQGVINTISSKGYGSDSTSIFMKSTTAIITVVEGLLNGLVNLTFSASLTNILSTPMYNRDSLEAMWKNRTILKLKLWNGWKFKYVVITNIDITKEAIEDGVEEAVITCTEVPIMTMRTKASIDRDRAQSQLLLEKLKSTGIFKRSTIQKSADLIADGAGVAVADSKLDIGSIAR